MSEKKVAVVAIGSNCLIKNVARRTIDDQYRAAKETCAYIADLVEAGWDIAIGHGNRPQVEYMLLRSEIAHKVDGLHEVPLDTLIADTQGAIGYWLQQNLQNILAHRGIKKNVATIVTQVLVDRADPAFETPSYPIGGFMEESEAARRQSEMGWTAIEDDEKRWRSVVPAPLPEEIVEFDSVRNLIKAGTVVITSGGGGIPVVDQGDGDYCSVVAVIDNDDTCSLLARKLEADIFIVLTGVPKVALNYGNLDQKWIDKLTLSEARHYLAEGKHFGEGGMGTKIRAIIRFLEAGGKHAIITNPVNIRRAIQGEAGTHFTIE